MIGAKAIMKKNLINGLASDNTVSISGISAPNIRLTKEKDYISFILYNNYTPKYIFVDHYLKTWFVLYQASDDVVCYLCSWLYKAYLTKVFLCYTSVCI